MPPPHSDSGLKSSSGLEDHYESTKKLFMVYKTLKALFKNDVLRIYSWPIETGSLIRRIKFSTAYNVFEDSSLWLSGQGKNY